MVFRMNGPRMKAALPDVARTNVNGEFVGRRLLARIAHEPCIANEIFVSLVILIALKEAAYNDSPWRSIGQDPVEIDPMPADHLGTS